MLIFFLFHIFTGSFLPSTSLGKKENLDNTLMEIHSSGIKYETISKSQTLKISKECYELTVSKNPKITIKATDLSIIIAKVTTGHPIFKLFGPIIFSILSGNAEMKVYIEDNIFPMCYISLSTSQVNIEYINEAKNDDFFNAFITRNGLPVFTDCQTTSISPYSYSPGFEMQAIYAGYGISLSDVQNITINLQTKGIIAQDSDLYPIYLESFSFTFQLWKIKAIFLIPISILVLAIIGYNIFDCVKYCYSSGLCCRLSLSSFCCCSSRADSSRGHVSNSDDLL